MRILGLLGMYFDAVVVEVKTFIQIDFSHTVLLEKANARIVLCATFPSGVDGARMNKNVGTQGKLEKLG